MNGSSHEDEACDREHYVQSPSGAVLYNLEPEDGHASVPQHGPLWMGSPN